MLCISLVTIFLRQFLTTVFEFHHLNVPQLQKKTFTVDIQIIYQFYLFSLLLMFLLTHYSMQNIWIKCWAQRKTH